MNTLLALLTTLISTAATAPATVAAETCAPLPAATTFTLTQRFFTFGTDFALESEGRPVGKIVERKFNLGRTFELVDVAGNLVARAEKRLASWGTQIDIYDCAHRPIGRVKEHVLRSLHRRHSVYSILDARGALVAQSETWHLLGTSIVFKDGIGREQGRLARGVINVFRDTWSAEFTPDSVLDRRLLLFAAAYKTSADAEKNEDPPPPPKE